MIWRPMILIGTVGLAYALLQGWPEVLPGVMRACLAVLALVAGVGLWAKRPNPNEVVARNRRPPTWLDYAAIATAVLALESGLLWLLGTAPRPLESAAIVIEQYLRPDTAALRAMQDDERGARSGNWLWTQETRRPLPKRTRFKPSMKPELFLRLQDRKDAQSMLKNRVFVRAFALSHYENSSWSPLAGSRVTIKADSSGFVRLAPSRAGRSIHHEVFHAEDPGGQNAFSALQGATEVRIPSLTRVDDGLHLLPPIAVNGGYQYRVRSTPLRLEDLPDGELLRAWPGAPDDLLAIPETGALAGRLQSMARKAAGMGPIKQQLLQLQHHLQSNFEYSLRTHNSRNLDPIENFLFEEKRGHCEFFATAGALMARALGIPSRMAYGWAGGTWYESSGLFVFRANEAHAWTEVWLENHGWVMMDPTPRAAADDNRAKVAPPGEKPADTLADEDNSYDLPQDDLDEKLPRIALALMLGFALPAGLIAILRGCRRFGGGDDAPQSMPRPGSGKVPGYFKSWRRACAARGTPMPPGTTLRRQVVHMPNAPEFSDELLKYHYGTSYEGMATDPKTEKRLAQRIREWQAAPTPDYSE